MKKIFITGAGGFIGSHLTEMLLSLGYKVKAYIQYNSINSNGWLQNLDKKYKNNIEIIFGDIRDSYNLENSIKNCDYVFHLAALIAIPYSYKSPQSYIETNILGTLNVIRAAKKNNVKKIIHTSSSEVYGTAQKIPIKENHPLVGQSPYAASKIGADQIAISMCRSSNIPIVIVRPFNTFGPRQSLRAVIPTIISQFVAKRSILKIGNLNTSRDFNFVEDICNGFISAMNSKYKNSEIFNLATEREIKIYEIISLLEQISGFKPKILVEKRRHRPKKSEVFRLIGSCQYAKEKLKYKQVYASKAGFKEALKKTYDWYLKNMNLYNENFNKYNL
jgi:dTDP-glucose 4,6-dehydratase